MSLKWLLPLEQQRIITVMSSQQMIETQQSFSRSVKVHGVSCILHRKHEHSQVKTNRSSAGKETPDEMSSCLHIKR